MANWIFLNSIFKIFTLEIYIINFKFSPILQCKPSRTSSPRSKHKTPTPKSSQLSTTPKSMYQTMPPNAPSWRINNKNNPNWLRSHPNQMRPNALTKEKPKKKPRKTTTNKWNHHLINNKFQEEDVHSWVDQKKKETLTFSKQTLVTMSPSSPNSITTFHLTR